MGSPQDVSDIVRFNFNTWAAALASNRNVALWAASKIDLYPTILSFVESKVGKSIGAQFILLDRPKGHHFDSPPLRVLLDFREDDSSDFLAKKPYETVIIIRDFEKFFMCRRDFDFFVQLIVMKPKYFSFMTSLALEQIGIFKLILHVTEAFHISLFGMVPEVETFEESIPQDP